MLVTIEQEVPRQRDSCLTDKCILGEVGEVQRGVKLVHIACTNSQKHISTETAQVAQGVRQHSQAALA